MTQLLYVDELLEAVRANFISMYKDDIRLSNLKAKYDFDNRCDATSQTGEHR